MLAAFVLMAARLGSLGEGIAAGALLAQDVGPVTGDFSTILLTLIGTSPLAAVCFYGWWRAERKLTTVEVKYDGLVERLFKMIDTLAPLVSAGTDTLHEVQEALTDAARLASQKHAAQGTEAQIDALMSRIEHAMGDKG